MALDRVISRIKERIDSPSSFLEPGVARAQKFGIAPADYKVLATTDEPTGSPLLDDMRALGWNVLDHGALDTVKDKGPWLPAILDSAILSRGQGFVGTEKSTFSHLAGLRVK